MLDIKITNGLIVDGTGSEPFHADLGILQGKIVSIGTVDEDATKTIDASGMIVTPGFIDLHTHYDGQNSWDETLAPSVYHGITTAVTGSCGVGFAPCRVQDRERLIRLMEGVEDIPGTALSEGMVWGWETFPEYMEAMDAMPHCIDFATQVPHDALRVYVMGDRAVSHEAASAQDIADMQKLLREALDAGAAGFSTGRSDVHRSADGDWTPASEASQEELVGLAQAFAGFEHGVLQMVNDFDLERDPNRFDAEFDILEAFARAGAGRNMSLSLMQRDMAPNQWCKILERVDAAKKNDLTIHVQVAPRGIGVMVGLSCTFHPFMGFPSYKAIADKPLEERVASMREPDFKAKMLTETSESVSGEGSSVPPLVDIFLQNLEMVSAKLFRLGEQPDYEQPFEQSIYMQAKAAEMPVLEAIYEAVLENDGRALLYFPIYNYTEFDYANVLSMLKHPQAIPGLSDGGAHVGTVCDASFPTYTLSHWTRDRTRGEKIKLKDAVHFMTEVPAQYMGFYDRGVLKEGAKADINVIDHANLNLKHPVMVKDLPGGGQRLMQHAQGYRATIVSGQIVLENDVLSDARPGRLVRLHELGAKA